MSNLKTNSAGFSTINSANFYQRRTPGVRSCKYCGKMIKWKKHKKRFGFFDKGTNNHHRCSNVVEMPTEVLENSPKIIIRRKDTK